MTDQSRDAFEFWYFGDGAPPHAREFKDGAYKFIATNVQWHAWQAATAAERERCAKEAEHWQTISTTPGHACGQYIAAAIRQGGV